jgi:hypothetical protein
MHLQKVKNTLIDIIAYPLIHTILIVCVILVSLLFWIWDLAIFVASIGKKK